MIESESWAIVEQLGHVRYAGRVTEEEKFGVKMLRIDIPDGEGFLTKFLGGATLYSVTIVTEAVARQVSKGTTPSPVHPWDYPIRELQRLDRDEDDEP